jgi:hypothetical protein
MVYLNVIRYKDSIFLFACSQPHPSFTLFFFFFWGDMVEAIGGLALMKTA